MASRSRTTPVANWYLDLSLLDKYWGHDRTYHHTAPISMNYALREALRIVAEEGLEGRFARHRQNAEMLWEGLEALDLPPLVAYEHRLPTLTTATLMPSIDDAAVRRRLLDEYNIEIAGGLGIKMADPKREVYVMVGDGSYLMLNSELATAAAAGIKVVDGIKALLPAFRAAAISDWSAGFLLSRTRSGLVSRRRRLSSSRMLLCPRR